MQLDHVHLFQSVAQDLGWWIVLSERWCKTGHFSKKKKTWGKKKVLKKTSASLIWKYHLYSWCNMTWNATSVHNRGNDLSLHCKFFSYIIPHLLQKKKKSSLQVLKKKHGQKPNCCQVSRKKNHLCTVAWNCSLFSARLGTWRRSGLDSPFLKFLREKKKRESVQAAGRRNEPVVLLF